MHRKGRLISFNLLLRSTLGAFFIALGAVLVHASPSFAAEAVSYSYDELGRVIRVQYTGGPNNGLIIEYQYDAAGNRTSVVVS